MLEKMLYRLTVLSFITATGCSSLPGASEGDNLVSCPPQRPEICTMQYDPVCGTLSDGGRQTYSSDCQACSNHNVVGYVKGECK